MGKICVVKSCQSGRKLKTTKKYTHVSFFQPSSPERLEKWQRSLGIALKSNDYICHLHFKEEHIKLYEKIIINGEVKIFPVLKKMLKHEALPTIEHQFIPISAHELETSLITELQMSGGKNQKNFKCNSIKKQKLLKNLGLQNNRRNYEKYTKQKLKEFMLNHSHDDFYNYMENETTRPSVDNFKEMYQKFLPPFWMYAENPLGLEFMRMDPAMKQMKHHIRVNEDSSVTVIYPNNEELHLNMTLDTFNNTYDFLKYVERWPLCVGTQIDSNKYSKFCKDILVSDDAYKRHQRNPRCRACRFLRIRLKNRKPAPSSSETALQQRRRLANIVKQNRRLRNTKIMLKKKLFMTNYEYARKSAEVLQALETLPESFQEIVNSCFEPANESIVFIVID